MADTWFQFIMIDFKYLFIKKWNLIWRISTDFLISSDLLANLNLLALDKVNYSLNSILSKDKWFLSSELLIINLSYIIGHYLHLYLYCTMFVRLLNNVTMFQKDYNTMLFRANCSYYYCSCPVYCPFRNFQFFFFEWNYCFT